MFSQDNKSNLANLAGKTIVSIEGLTQDSSEVTIFTKSGGIFKFFHYQDCCENVYLSDFENDISSHEGALILSAEELSNEEIELLEPPPDNDSESYTWTFYTINTDRGSLWLRWIGESNGYYSEEMHTEWLP
jgi:hypothetical protein